MQCLKRFFVDDDGPTSVEYAVMLALIVGMIIAAIAMMGGAVEAYWDDSATRFGESVDG